MFKITFVLLVVFIVAASLGMRVVFRVNPVAIGQYLVAQVGSTLGITVSIPPNPFNMLAQQLAEKEKELGQKEATLEAQTNEKQKSQNKILISIGALGSILFALIALNFYFDWRRRRK